MKKKNSVLIVDDDMLNLMELTHILQPDYKVHAVRDGFSALEKAHVYSPDLILLDVIMPEMNGLEVLEKLKESEKTRAIPVIFITGSKEEGNESKGLAIGAADYIAKPFNPAIVKLRVQNQLKIVNHTNTLNRRIQEQALITRITRSFLTDTHIDTLFSDALRMVGEFMDISQVLLYMFEDNNMLICRHEWINPKLNMETRLGEKLELDSGIISTINDKLASEKDNFYYHSNDPSHDELMKPYRKHFNNFITTPVLIKGKMCAVLDFSRDGDNPQWSESEIALAILVSSILSGVLERDAIERDLNVVLKLKAELTVAKEKAEHSDRAKSEFLSRMSHEMLTPMNTIMGLMQVAKLHGIPKDEKEFLNEMNKSANYLLNLINDVLDISGIEYGIFKLSNSVFNFNEMVQEVLHTAEYNASLKWQTLTTNIDPLIPVILTGDKKHLKQVIANLLANAVKYTPEEGKICFDSRKLSEDNETITLQIEVSDNGIGISEEQQKHLFDIFEQADGSINRKQGGIGIGLVLSKRIIEMMGGSIWVDSELDKGAKFYFTCKIQKRQ